MRRLLLVLLLVLLPRPASAAAWVAPLGGPLVVDRPFQAPSTAYGAGHRGVDLRGTAGQPVLAAGAGRVSYAGLLAGRGVVTVVHSGGLRTTYEPLMATVRVGQLVGVGQPIGALGRGHCRDGGTCLHWGLLRGETYLDPLALLGSSGVRLLPLEDPGGSPAGGPGPGGAGTVRAGTGGAGTGGAGTGGAGTGHGGPADPVPVLRHPVVQPVQAAPPPAPHLVLRAADRVSGAAAVLLLGLGLLMLVRRPGSPPPRQPAAPSAIAMPAEAGGLGGATPVDLEVERARRRTG